jgi:hypothetical protein
MRCRTWRAGLDEKKTPTDDADVFKYLSWQETLEALHRSTGLEFRGGGKN